jgi:branched-chain amino acid aminotransferase
VPAGACQSVPQLGVGALPSWETSSGCRDFARMAVVIHRFILHNDAIREAMDLSLSPGQVGLLSGWGVFSTLRVADGVLFAFERHWARIKRDASAMHVPLPHDPEAVRAKLVELVEANRAPNCTLRLVVVRNGGGMWAGKPTGRDSDVIALTVDSKDWGAGVKLAYQSNGRFGASPFSGAKILSWAMNLTWLESAQWRGFDEVILLDERGEVSECTSANIFIARGREVLTPPLTSGCLPGVTRELLLGEIQAPGVKVSAKAFRPADLEAADEVFITSTTRDLLPVVQVEGKKVGGGGKACEALSQAFREYVRKYVAEHAAESVEHPGRA